MLLLFLHLIVLYKIDLNFKLYKFCPKYQIQQIAKSKANKLSFPPSICIITMKYNTVLFNIFVIITLINLASSANVICNSTVDPLIGCTACTNPASQSLALNIQTQKYICTDITKCQSVLNNQTCIQCQTLYYLTTNSSNHQICQPINLTNCLIYDSSTNKCQQCFPNYRLSLDGTQCFNNSNIFCLNYSSANNCSSCMFSYMNSSNNCTVEPSICSYFDYNLMKCLACPNNTYLNNQGTYCIQKFSNCLLPSNVGCALCQQQYQIVLNASAYKLNCVFKPQINYQFWFFNNQTTCLNKKLEYITDFNNSNNSCKPPLSNISYCSTDNGNGTCLACLPGFYQVLVNSTSTQQCAYCKSVLQNCILCQSSTKCTMCELLYFVYNQTTSVNGVSTTIAKCRTCSVYGCKKCGSIDNVVKCLQCQRGYQLYNFTCYQCNSMTSLNFTTLQCDSCASIDINCQYCDLSTKSCLWCNNLYARVLSGTNFTCRLIANLSTIDLTSPSTISQIIIKAFPQQQNLIYKNSIQLMSSCQQKANLYTCLCNSMTGVTSLCYSIGTNIKKFTDFNSVFGTNNISNQLFLKNTQTIRLMAQLPIFDSLNFNVDSTALIPENKIAALLEIYTQVLRRQAALIATSSAVFNNQNKHRLLINSSQILSQLYAIIRDSFSLSLVSTQPTIVYGNGYYFKYYPVNISDSSTTDTSFISITNRNITQFACVFVWFQNSQTSKSLSGNIYIFTPTVSTYTLNIKQLQHPSANGGYSYQIYLNNTITKTSTITKSGASQQYLTFAIQTSTSSFLYQYDVQYQLNSATDLNQLYSYQRIQFIFYQPAFVYVLIFLVLYLFLIPCCSLVNVIEPKTAHRRKRVRSVDYTQSQQAKQNQMQRQQDNSQQAQVIQINYKDFFPIYNICNTPRPRRILKLCLFLLNVQHGITFLTLFYFNLQPDHPVLAVILGLPGYFCTIIMAYICGILTLVLPGFLKYLINLIAIGYWILWVALMPRFLSQEYQPYVYIFTIVYFIIDLIIDALETFMVYFTIKQSERQIKMFSCLAAWLSKRGFYEYDKLAKQMNDSQG